MERKSNVILKSIKGMELDRVAQLFGKIVQEYAQRVKKDNFTADDAWHLAEGLEVMCRGYMTEAMRREDE